MVVALAQNGETQFLDPTVRSILAVYELVLFCSSAPDGRHRIALSPILSQHGVVQKS